MDVRGVCPACGTALLFLGDGGYLTCSLHDCPDPGAADRLLQNSRAVTADSGEDSEVAHAPESTTILRGEGIASEPRTATRPTKGSPLATVAPSPRRAFPPLLAFWCGLWVGALIPTLIFLVAS